MKINLRPFIRTFKTSVGTLADLEGEYSGVSDDWILLVSGDGEPVLGFRPFLHVRLYRARLRYSLVDWFTHFEAEVERRVFVLASRAGN